ncbi:MAG: glycosyltransferase family 2 protein [Anaerolineaceae bacterium]
MIIKKLVSIVIVNWNHRLFLPSCLEALKNQTYSPIEIFVIDNASSDGSTDWIQEKHPDIKIKVFEENMGFSKAFNYGMTLAKGEFVLSLNPDVVTAPDFIDQMVKWIDMDERVWCAAPKLMRANNPSLIDSTGLFLNYLRKPYDRGQNEKDEGQYDAKTEVFGACGAAALYRKEMVEEISINGEFLDEDFFAYYEDVDISWRAKILGWRCIFVPTAIATHVRGWGDTLHKQSNDDLRNVGTRLALKNRYLLIIKNDRFKDIWMYLPLILLVDSLRNFYLLFFYPRVLLGLFDVFRLVPKVIQKRQIINQKRIQNANIQMWFFQ